MAGGGEKGQKMEDPSDPNLPPALPPRNTDEGGTEQVAVVKGVAEVLESVRLYQSSCFMRKRGSFRFRV